MRIFNCFIVFCSLAAVSPSALHACWAAPEEVVWNQTRNGHFEFKRENFTGKISVFNPGDRENALWSVEVPEFSGLFSSILLTENGDTIVHVKSNHQVHKPEDTGVQIFTKDGESVSLPVSDFIKALAAPEQPLLSTSPGNRWLSSIGELRNRSLKLTTIDGKDHVIAFGKQKDPAKK